MKKLKGHFSSVYTVAYSPDGKCLVSGSSDGTIKIWTEESEVFIKDFKTNSKIVNSVAFSPDG